MFRIYDGREQFYQWDLDRKLIVEDEAITEVHFCNRTDNCSLVCETYVEDGLTVVDVPNILLQTDWKIRVYAYDGKHTKHDGCFEVKGRTMPTDYIYQETKVRKLVGQRYYDGEMAQGEIFGNYEDNVAQGEFTAAFGSGTVAGQKGYYMKAVNLRDGFIALSSSPEKVMPVESVSTLLEFREEGFISGFAEGDTVSIINGAHYHFCATITDIEDNLIVLNKIPFNSIDAAGAADVDDNVIFVPAKPTVGTTSITIGGFAAGLGSVASGKGSFVSGRDNIGAGDSAFVGGRRNKAGYIASVSGLDNSAIGNYSFATNRGNTSSGEMSAAFGCVTKAKGLDAFAIGNNTVASGAHSLATGLYTEARGECMTVGGMCNSTKNGALVVYGNGANTSYPNDAYILDWDGNGKYSGHINTKYIKEDYFANGKVKSTVNNISNFDGFTKPGFYNFVWYHKNDGGEESYTPWKITVSTKLQDGKLIKIYQMREAFGAHSGRKYWLDTRVGTVDDTGAITWGEWEFVVNTTARD